MKTYDFITPEGTRDLLFEECKVRRTVEERLREIFIRKGYSEVITPGLEFYDVFNRKSRYFSQESMYKLVDTKGRLLVLRPDSTMPIARLVATRLRGAYYPMKLYYNQSIYTANRSNAGRSDEFVQSGIEILGGDTKRADLEALSTAIEVLTACGARDFRLEIGNIAYFKALMAKLPAAEAVRERIRELIEAKNYPALGELLGGIGDTPVTRVLAQLPRLFGGAEVLDKAAALFGSPETDAVLASLRAVYADLCKLGLNGNITVDLGLVNRTDYYTGVLFRGYIEGCGEAVLSGGRYDNLIAEFGKELPATGFGVNVDAIARVLPKEESKDKPDLLVYGKDGYEMQALLYTEELLTKGERVENSVSATLEEARRYASAKGIHRLVIVGEQTETVEVDEHA